MNLNAALREEGRGGTSGRGATLVRRGLATAQVAIAFVLLVGAGLLLASFRAVLSVDPGFEPDDVITARRDPAGDDVSAEPALVASSDALLPTRSARCRASRPPASTSAAVQRRLQQQRDPRRGLPDEARRVADLADADVVSDRLLRGDGHPARQRPLSSTRATRRRAPRVVIVDERLARKFWPDQDPIGRRMYQPTSAKDILAITPETQFFTVVGVVK